MRPPSAPPDALVARFGAAIALPVGQRLGLAVSGGGDSLALLLLAHAALNGRIFVATVDHGLRPEAGAEAAMVGAICADLGVPHTTLNEADAPLPCGNLQEQARLLRYRLLGNWARSLGIGHVATAHHRDDVAEGFLMRALRGSGVGGLARMASSAPMPMADDIVLLRPLLDWSHLELVAIVVAAGLIPVQDSSNADLRFDRARIRDLLAGSTLLDPAALARSAANLAEAEAAIDWMAAQAWRNRSQVEDGMVRLDPEGLPRELRRRLCRRAVEMLAPGWDGEGLDGLLDALDSGAIATLAGVQATPGPEWRFRRAAPHRSAH